MMEKTYRSIMENNRPSEDLISATIERMEEQRGALGERKGRLSARFLRRSACMAAGLAAAFLLLFGVNAVNPALAEGIPGVGKLFEVLRNNAELSPLAANADPVAVSEKIGLEATALTDSGYGLTVDEAYCDGVYLYFNLEVSCPESAAQYEGVYPEWAFPDGAMGGNFGFQIDGKKAEIVTRGCGCLDPETLREDMFFVLALPEKAREGQRLNVSLHMDTLYGDKGEDENYAVRADEIETGFTAGFPVTANAAGNHGGSVSAEDNGVKLYSVIRTPGYIFLDMEIPFWGRQSDYLDSDDQTVIGTACLYTEDGRETESVAAMSSYDFSNLDNSERIRGVWVFGVPAEDGPAVLRVYEHDPLSQWLGKSSAEEKPGVFAEFTIDWETGKAAASDSYAIEGLEKLDTQEFLASPRHADFTDGCLVTATGLYWREEGYFGYVNICSNMEAPSLEARFYKDGELVGAAPAEIAVEDMRERTNGEAKQLLKFELAFPEYSGEDWDLSLVSDHIDLVNAETGAVLLENLHSGDAWQPAA